MFADKYTYETRAVSIEARANKHWHAMMALLSALLACAVFVAGTRVALAADTAWGKLQDAITAASSGREVFDDSVASVSIKKNSDTTYATVTLKQDITASTSDTTPLYVNEGTANVILDLGTYSIDRHLSKAVDSGCVISNSGNLTIKGSGKITGGKNSTTDSTSGALGGGIYNGSGGVLTLEGGDICGNVATGNGGGIFISADSAFIMVQGTIEQNTAASSDNAIYYEGDLDTAYTFPFFTSEYKAKAFLFYAGSEGDGSDREQYAAYTDVQSITQEDLNSFGYLSINYKDDTYIVVNVGETQTVSTGIENVTNHYAYELEDGKEVSTGDNIATLKLDGTTLTAVGNAPGFVYYRIESPDVTRVYTIDVYGTLAFSETTITRSLTSGSFTNTLTKNPDEMRVVFRSSDTSVATVDSSTGEVTPVSIGTTVITATNADDTCNAIPASYTLNITNGCTIHFDKNADDATGTMADQTITAATAINTCTFTRTGYRFAAWNTAADGSGTAYLAGATYPADGVSLADVTLYAQWVEGTAETVIKIENAVINSGSPLSSVTTSSTTAAIATAGVYTTAELAEIATGSVGYLWFVVSQGTADASAISNFLTEKGITDSGLTLDFTADIQLWKRVGSGTDVQVTETTSPLTVVLSLSDAQIPSDPGKRTWYVVREHDGAYQLLNAKFDASSKTLSFPCNAFSNFSVIYTSASTSERTTTSSTTTKSSGTTTSTTSTKTSSSSATPSTADNSVPQAAVAALFVLGAGCTVLSIKRR